LDYGVPTGWPPAGEISTRSISAIRGELILETRFLENRP
jgi:hypothetical protein